MKSFAIITFGLAVIVAVVLSAIVGCQSPAPISPQQIQCSIADAARAAEILAGPGDLEDKLVQVLEQVGPSAYQCLESQAKQLKAQKKLGRTQKPAP